MLWNIATHLSKALLHFKGTSGDSFPWVSSASMMDALTLWHLWNTFCMPFVQLVVLDK